MILAIDCVRRIEPVPAALPAAQARDILLRRGEVPGLPVAGSDGGIAAVLGREAFLARCAGPFGFSLASHRPVGEWCALPGLGSRPDPVPASMPVEELAALFAEIGDPGAGRIKVVLAGRQYRGLVTQGDCLAGLLAQARVQTAALAAAREGAEMQGRAKDAFLANMSHELRTPLTAVIGFAEAAAEIPSSADQAEMLRLVRGAGESLLAVVNDLLDLARIGSGSLRLAPAPFPPAELAADVVAVLRPRAGVKRLALRLVVGDGLPAQVLGDAHRLRQVLANLVGNAIKFTERGAVTVRLGWRAGVLTASVEDTGVGIAAADLPRLFRPFSQVDDSLTRRHQGAGLGLAISRQLAELMGGRLTVASQPGRGSTFSLMLPLPRIGGLPAVPADGPALAAGLR